MNPVPGDNGQDDKPENSAEQIALLTFQQVQAISDYIKDRDKADAYRERLIKVMQKAHLEDKKFLKGIIVFLGALLLLFAGIQGIDLIRCFF